MNKKLFFYGVLVRINNQYIVKFGQTHQLTQEDSTQYAVNETAGKFKAVLSSKDVIFCKDITERALSDQFSPQNHFAKYDDYARNFIKNNGLNTGYHTYNRRNDVGGGSREVHTYPVESITPETIKSNWILSINEFVTGSKKLAIYPPRTRQQEAIDKMVVCYKEGETNQNFLLGAIMCFGKNFTFLTFSKKVTKPGDNILVLTNKPGVFSSLEGDINNHVYFENFNFILLRDVKDLQNLKTDPNKINIIAVSKQLTDNRTRKRSVRNFLKNIKFTTAMFDECHSGTDTEAFENLRSDLNIEFTVWTSGTSFKTVVSQGFTKENSYFYSYIEQQIDKRNGDLPDAVTLETLIPTIDNEFTSNPNFTNEEGFTLKKLFAVDDNNGQFINGGEVKDFLKDVLGKSTKKSKVSPYRKRGNLDHTIWLVPDSVAIVKAIGRMIENITDEYKVIIASGDETKDIQDVHNAIKLNKKTITLTIGRFVEGTTVPEWTGAFVMSDTESVEKYFQFIFRVTSNNEVVNKDIAYVFDFSLERTFQMIFEFARSQAENTDTNDIQEVIREWLDNNNVYRAGDGAQFKKVNIEEVLELINTGDYKSSTLMKSTKQYITDPTSEIFQEFAGLGLKKKIKISTGFVTNNSNKGKNYNQSGGKERTKQEIDELKEGIANVAGAIASFPLIKYLEGLNTVEEIINKLDLDWFKDYTGMDKDLFNKLIQYKLIDTRFINLYL